MSRFIFIGSCVSLDGDVINHMKHGAKQIYYEDFIEAVGKVVAQTYDEERPVPMADDWGITFWRSTLPSGRPVVYYADSGIEFVFTEAAKYDEEAELAALEALEANSSSERHLFHSAPRSAMSSIKDRGLVPRRGPGLFSHGGYDHHSQGKLFFADNEDAAHTWHGKVEDMLVHHHDDERRHAAVMLRVRHRETELDDVGDRDVSGSRFTRTKVHPSEIEYWHHEYGWSPIVSWSSKDHPAGSIAPPEGEERASGAVGAAAHARHVEAKAREKQEAAEKLRQQREETRRHVEAQAAQEKWEAPPYAESVRGKRFAEEWEGKSREERLAEAARRFAIRVFPGAPAPISMDTEVAAHQREVLGVDREGNEIGRR